MLARSVLLRFEDIGGQQRESLKLLSKTLCEFHRIIVRLRHSIGERAIATGIVILVWWLLVPPYVGLDRFDPKAPLVRWYETADFGSQSDCQRYRADAINRYQELSSADPSGSRAHVQLFKESQCVSSDDPRRVGN